MAPPPPPSPSPSPPPAALPEELIEQILLRFPPGEPASLLRTALVCKRWRRLVSGPGFRRRFGEFHRTPPMLGMFCSGCSRVYSHFEPTTTFRPRHASRVCSHFEPTTTFRPRHADRAHKLVLDARHGRVLLRAERRALVVWDPITDEERKVPLPRSPPQYMGPLTWTAAVLCSSAGCNHLDCHRGPFIVVVVSSAFGIGTAGVVQTLIFTYSSDAAAWSEPICVQQTDNIGGLVDPHMRSALVGNALYFGFMELRTVLKYNMQLRQTSWIQLPSSVPLRRILLTTTDDGRLGLATEHESKLYVWSRKGTDEVDATWEHSRVNELKMLLPVDDEYTSLVGSTDDLGIIFMRADNAVYTIDLKTYMGKKVCEGEIKCIVPYMSFYTPALEADSIGEGPSAGGSSA